MVWKVKRTGNIIQGSSLSNLLSAEGLIGLVSESRICFRKLNWSFDHMLNRHLVFFSFATPHIFVRKTLQSSEGEVWVVGITSFQVFPW